MRFSRPMPRQFLQGMRDDAALAAAAIAHGDVDELAEDALLRAADFAAAVALRAALRLGAGLGAKTVADGAQLGGLDLELLLGAEHGLLEGDGDRAASVGATGRTALRARTRAAEECVEDVAEAAEAEAFEAAREAVGAGLGRRVAEAVVHGALLRIGEHLVRLADLFELGLGAGFLVAVRVELHRQLAEGLLHLLGAGAARHAEDIVVVLFLLCSHLACIAP